MAISKKTRFEVFKRDGFQCQYCGKQSPQVVLETDHIISRNKGGGDNIENLTTSCFDCNRGKGKELLETYKEGTDPNEQAILLLERERQLKEYNEVLKQVRKRKDKDLSFIRNYWDSKCPVFSSFAENVVRKALDHLPKEQILEAIDICMLSHRKQDDKTWAVSWRSYLSGILRNMTNNFGKDSGS